MQRSLIMLCNFLNVSVLFGKLCIRVFTVFDMLAAHAVAFAVAIKFGTDIYVPIKFSSSAIISSR